MTTTAKLSLAEYEQIVSTGVFDGPNQRRIELIRGELREMNPIGPIHAYAVDRLIAWSIRSMPSDTVALRVQNPLALLNVDSEPEPDVVWIKNKDYSTSHPTAADVLLIIEVAQSSLDFDRGEKAELYAEVGIQEYWIVNLGDRTLEINRNSQAGRYRDNRTLSADETASPLVAPQAVLSVAQLLAAPG